MVARAAVIVLATQACAASVGVPIIAFMKAWLPSWMLKDWPESKRRRPAWC
jgi:hypothetical protein